MIEISIHALLAESDGAGLSSCFGRIIFLSTLSLRRATKKPWTTCEILPISIHALLAESDTTGASLQSPTRISIHALLAESDRIKAPKVTRHMNFYPRSPCGERPGRMTENGTKKLTFLSTLSLRRATCYSFRHSASCWYFYPRSPCGERLPAF